MFVVVRSTIGVAIALGFAGCSGGPDPSPVLSAPLAPTAAVVPSAPAPIVTALSVNTGSTGGGTPIKIRGTELHRGASVTFGTATVASDSYDPRDAPGTSLLINTPAHTAGVVDVIVTNPNRQTFRLSQGYEYRPQQSFDFNGEWDGVTTDGSDTLVQFIIKNSMLITTSCQGQANRPSRSQPRS